MRINELVVDLQVDTGTSELFAGGAKPMTTDFNSNGSGEIEKAEAAATGWLKLGVVAAASGILGGLAAAWYYRKTLAQLREEDHQGGGNPVSDNPEDQNYDI
ncbi:MAG TPA: hypothetical protein VN151_10935 [Terracidiphilus sp.]|nr:hypothetical protein [Terracidiphilus sp.]